MNGIWSMSSDETLHVLYIKAYSILLYRNDGPDEIAFKFAGITVLFEKT